MVLPAEAWEAFLNLPRGTVVHERTVFGPGGVPIRFVREAEEDADSACGFVNDGGFGGFG